MKSINVQGGFLFCKRDVTFIREMRVISNHFVVFQVFVRKLFLAFSNIQSSMADISGHVVILIGRSALWTEDDDELDSEGGKVIQEIGSPRQFPGAGSA